MPDNGVETWPATWVTFIFYSIFNSDWGKGYIGPEFPLPETNGIVTGINKFWLFAYPNHWGPEEVLPQKIVSLKLEVFPCHGWWLGILLYPNPSVILLSQTYYEKPISVK